MVMQLLRRRRYAVLLGVAAVAIAGGIVAALLLASGGGGSFSGPSAAALYAKEAKFGTFSAYVPGSDPDELDRAGSNVDNTIRFLGHGRYQLTIQNVGFLGYINSFQWNAPNLTITKVVGSSSGSCHAGPERTVATQYGPTPEASVSCTGMAIKPPKCSCQVGGTATVTFEGHPLVATKGVVYGIEMSRLVVGNVTLVPYHIPSYLGGAPNQVDLPLCGRGQQSTTAHPCVQSH